MINVIYMNEVFGPDFALILIVDVLLFNFFVGWVYNSHLSVLFDFVLEVHAYVLDLSFRHFAQIIRALFLFIVV